MISASSLERVEACPMSEKLPHADRITTASNRGTAIHEFLANIARHEYDGALERVPEEFYDACAAIDVSALPACRPDGFAHEVALAYDPTTGKGREIGREVGRHYDCEAHEIPGTADVIGLADDGETVIVLDYKTGFADVTPAVRNLQIQFYALAAARAFGRKQARGGIIRIKPDGSSWYDAATFSAFDLDRIQARIAKIVESISPAERPTMGDHCTYCPALRYCPAQMNLIRQFAHAPEEIDVTARDVPVEPSQAAEALMRVKALKKACEAAEATLKDVARREALPMPDGKVWGPVVQRRESIEGTPETVAILQAHFGPRALRVASMQITKSRIRDVAREVAQEKGGTIKARTDALLNELREVGAISSLPQEQFRTYDAPAGA